MPTLEHERRLGGPVCGIDEVGRGPWAGPVVAAAVMLDFARVPDGLDDSKRLPAVRRRELDIEIRACAHVSIAMASVEEVDRLNVLGASMLAMERAFAGLPHPPVHALVDGNRLPRLPCPGTAIVGGDGLCASIAAASIVAKVARDALMAELAGQHPGYGWERNAGYGTREHQDGLARLGVTMHHRRSFRPIAALLATM
ncbi:MAG: ribonuclease HII [Proteobacteria bacterium]|nr:ribonuclease HII [Pseudomonadota bacterium]